MSYSSKVVYLTKICAMLYSITLMGCGSLSGEELPSREDCIVRVSIAFDVEYSVGDMNSINSRLPLHIEGRDVRVSGITFHRASAHEYDYYLQLRDHCEERVSLAQELIERHWSMRAPIADFVVHEDRISPSTGTIDLKGLYWLD